MTDKEYLEWLRDRLVLHYGEHPDIDFLHKLQSIIESMPKDQETPNTKSVPDWLRREYYNWRDNRLREARYPSKR